jgi:hypothetical protein
MIGLKVFFVYIVVGLPGLIYGSSFQYSLSTYLTFFLYITVFSIILHFTLTNLAEYQQFTKLYFSHYYYYLLAAIFLFIILILILEKPLGIMSLLNRDRAIRHELFFETGLPFLTRYFVMFSSSMLFYFLGSIAALLGGAKPTILGLLTSYSADSVTDSRSTIMAFFLGYVITQFVLYKLTRKSVKVTALMGVVALPFLVLGQESFADGVLTLRVFSYFSAPGFLSEEIYSLLRMPFLQSAMELLLWPLETLYGELFDTRYEYLFYFLPNGLMMNVLIPSYAVLRDPVDTGAFLLISLIIYITANFIKKIMPSFVPTTNLWILTIFGPLSLMRNPFLVEKGFFLFTIIVFFPLLALLVKGASKNPLARL